MSQVNLACPKCHHGFTTVHIEADQLQCPKCGEVMFSLSASYNPSALVVKVMRWIVGNYSRTERAYVASALIEYVKAKAKEEGIEFSS